jgi:hypothetical protein
MSAALPGRVDRSGRQARCSLCALKDVRDHLPVPLPSASCGDLAHIQGLSKLSECQCARLLASRKSDEQAQLAYDELMFAGLRKAGILGSDQGGHLPCRLLALRDILQRAPRRIDLKGHLQCESPLAPCRCFS